MLELTLAEFVYAGIEDISIASRVCKNLVSTAFFPFNISLAKLQRDDPVNVKKSPKFPGYSSLYPSVYFPSSAVIQRADLKPIGVLVFGSGSVIFVGAKDTDDVKKASQAVGHQVFAAQAGPTAATKRSSSAAGFADRVTH
jgi:TATA-box binding protein (TBP) (component of TFIID and TFIIIB)